MHAQFLKLCLFFLIANLTRSFLITNFSILRRSRKNFLDVKSLVGCRPLYLVQQTKITGFFGRHVADATDFKDDSVEVLFEERLARA